MSHGEDGLRGEALFHWHGHHDWRGGGRWQLGVHMGHMGGRPGAMFRGEHGVLLLLLLMVMVMEVAGCGGRGQRDLTDLSALRGHS